MHITDDSDLPEFLKADPAPPRGPIEIALMSDKPMDVKTSFDLMNRYSRSSPRAELGYRDGQAFETCAPVYLHMLGAVPPSYITGNDFAAGEMTTETLCDCFFALEDNRFFCVTLDCQGTDTLIAARQALIATLAEQDRAQVDRVAEEERQAAAEAMQTETRRYFAEGV